MPQQQKSNGAQGSRAGSLLLPAIDGAKPGAATGKQPPVLASSRTRRPPTRHSSLPSSEMMARLWGPPSVAPSLQPSARENSITRGSLPVPPTGSTAASEEAKQAAAACGGSASSRSSSLHTSSSLYRSNTATSEEKRQAAAETTSSSRSNAQQLELTYNATASVRQPPRRSNSFRLQPVRPPHDSTSSLTSPVSSATLINDSAVGLSQPEDAHLSNANNSAQAGKDGLLSSALQDLLAQADWNLADALVEAHEDTRRLKMAGLRLAKDPEAAMRMLDTRSGWRANTHGKTSELSQKAYVRSKTVMKDGDALEPELLPSTLAAVNQRATDDAEEEEVPSSKLKRVLRRMPFRRATTSLLPM